VGYRSQVVIALRGEEKVLLQKAIKHSKSLKGLISDADEEEDFDENTKTDCKLVWHSIKWYEGYSSIAPMMNFLNYLPEDTYYFIRLGEELDDIVFRGDYYDSGVYVERNIRW